jgi:hypothetical protein
MKTHVLRGYLSLLRSILQCASTVVEKSYLHMDRTVKMKLTARYESDCARDPNCSCGDLVALALIPTRVYDSRAETYNASRNIYNKEIPLDAGQIARAGG